MTARILFTAYVEGSDMGRAVRSRLLELCAAENVTGEVRVVDVAVEPTAAEAANVVGIPTVVREDPHPRRRVIGALDDSRRVAQALGLDDVRHDAESAGGAR